MPIARAPRNAKPLANKVLQLIREYPIQKQLEVTTWLSGHLRTNVAPDIRLQAKTASKTAVKTKDAIARSPTSRSLMPSAKRRAAGIKAAATRKARGTQRGGRPARTNSETHVGVEATSQVPA